MINECIKSSNNKFITALKRVWDAYTRTSIYWWNLPDVFESCRSLTETRGHNFAPCEKSRNAAIYAKGAFVRASYKRTNQQRKDTRRALKPRVVTSKPKCAYARARSRFRWRDRKEARIWIWINRAQSVCSRLYIRSSICSSLCPFVHPSAAATAATIQLAYIRSLDGVFYTCAFMDYLMAAAYKLDER